jgi:tetratricopeptide (TPR) repeat protein
MRQYILSFFILFLHHFVFAQNEMIDSLKTALNNTKTDTAKLRIYLSMNKACNKKDKLLYAEPALLLVDKLLSKETNKQKRHKLIDQEKALLNSVGEYYRGRNTADWNKAMTYFQSRLQSIEKKGDLKRTATFLYTMAGISIDEKKDSSLFRSYILRSLSVSKAIEDSASVVDAYSFMTAFYGSAGNYTEALGAAQSSISFCKKLNYEKGLARSYRSLAGLYQGFGEDEAALEYFQTAINLAQKIRDTVQICYALQSLGNFYNQQKNIKKAVEYFEQLQKLSTDYNNPSISQGNILRNFGYTYLNNNDPINALRHFEESLKIFENEKDYSYISLVLMDIGSVYNKQGDFERALSYNTHAIHILDSINDPFQFKSYLLYCQAKDYYGLKNYAKAKEINDKSKDDFKRDWFDLDGRIEIEIDSALGDGFGALAH